MRQELETGKEKARRSLRDRLAGAVAETVGGNLFGDTLADNIRGVDSTQDSRELEKQMWQSRLPDPDFHAVALELAWINLRGALPDEGPPSVLQDWV